MQISYLSDKWPWLGEHSSYGQLPFYIRKSVPVIELVTIKYEFFQRCIGKAYSIFHGWWWRRDTIFAAGELRFLPFLSKLKKKDSLCHVLYFDNHPYLWERWKKSPNNIIGTIHWPTPRRMPPRMSANLKRISSAIVLSKCDLEFYESLIGKGRVKFIHHGVDTEFFYPVKKRSVEPKRIMFTGQNGRNISMLYRVIAELAKRHPELQFDLLLRRERIKIDGFEQLVNKPYTVWHHDISDEELRRLYNASYLLLMPMNDMSANNAIVEALSCGVPVVTTDVGGIRDYGGGSIYPVIANDDDEAMIQLVEKYLGRPAWRSEIGTKCRRFAEKSLAWPIIAQKHIETYKDLLG